jgi:uncharacterized RDD family membrane protein YckC
MSDPTSQGYEISLSPPPPRATQPARAKPIARTLASPGVRLVAAIIDQCLVLSPLVAGWLLMPAAETFQTTAFRLRFWILGTLLIQVVQIILLASRGQTIGKLAVCIRIVDYDDESNPGFVNAVIWRSFIPGLLYLIPCLGLPFFFLIDQLCILGEGHRCLHDLMAGTKVVEL